MSPSRFGGQSVLATLFRYEIKRLLRDTRMILIAIVAPLVLFPLMIFVMRVVEESEETRLEETVYEYVLVGDEAASLSDHSGHVATIEVRPPTLEASAE